MLTIAPAALHPQSALQTLIVLRVVLKFCEKPSRFAQHAALITDRESNADSLVYTTWFLKCVF